MVLILIQRLDEEDRPTGCLLCPKRTDVEIDYKVSLSVLFWQKWHSKAVSWLVLCIFGSSLRTTLGASV